jgi:hypothetical protein
VLLSLTKWLRVLGRHLDVPENARERGAFRDECDDLHLAGTIVWTRQGVGLVDPFDERRRD